MKIMSILEMKYIHNFPKYDKDKWENTVTEYTDSFRTYAHMEKLKDKNSNKNSTDSVTQYSMGQGW